MKAARLATALQEAQRSPEGLMDAHEGCPGWDLFQLEKSVEQEAGPAVFLSTACLHPAHLRATESSPVHKNLSASSSDSRRSGGERLSSSPCRQLRGRARLVSGR